MSPKVMVWTNFENCRRAAHLPTPLYGITNASIDGYADVFFCHNLRFPWPGAVDKSIRTRLTPP
jgi:hypothetical protein